MCFGCFLKKCFESFSRHFGDKNTIKLRFNIYLLTFIVAICDRPDIKLTTVELIRDCIKLVDN